MAPRLRCLCQGAGTRIHDVLERVACEDHGCAAKEATVTNITLGRCVGALMLLHLAFGLIGPYVVLVPMTAPPGGFIQNAAAMAIATRIGVLVLVVGALIPVWVAVAAWRIWSARSPTPGFWLLVLGGANLTLQFVENGHWLTMLSVSEAYHATKPESEAGYAAVAVSVQQAFRWAHYGHIVVLVGWILVLFANLGRGRLLPRWLAGLGTAASVMHLLAIPLPEFLGLRLDSAALWGVPLALVYTGAAVVLVCRGFPIDAVAPSRTTQVPLCSAAAPDS